MICETRLDDSVLSSEVFPPNFVVYRCDRSEETEKFQKNKKISGGGVLIAIKNSIESHLIGTGAPFGAEQVWVKMKLNDRNIFLVEIYIRPDSPASVYEANMQALRNLSSKLNNEDILILSGDFNLPRLSWFTENNNDPEIAIPINASWKKELIILDTCHELGLLQINTHTNDNGNMLDLTWTNYADLVSCDLSEFHLLKHESHHPAFQINLHYLRSNKNNKNSQLKFRNFLGADYDIINNKLSEFDWDKLLSGINLEVNIGNFYEVIKKVISETVELKPKNTSSHPKWFDRDLINMKNRVSKLHKQKKSHNSIEIVEKHAELRKQYKKCARSAFKDYKVEMEHLINEDPTKFFDYVNSCRKTNDELPSEMDYNGSKLTSQQDIADSFAKHFATAYTEQSSFSSGYYKEYEKFLRNLCINIPSIDITEQLILETVYKLPNNTVDGPDEIPNIFIKKCIHTLIKPITYILRESFITGIVPEIWKRSYVKPVHKSGIKTKIDNYRGVALQCVISKLLDSIIANHLNFHMKNIIDDSQHGFVKGKSTVTNLIEFTSRTITKMEKYIQTDSIYLDIAKAFDSVNINLLIQKLNIMGLNEQIVNWIQSYLNGRQQIVRVSGAMSKTIEVTSGTGQGYPIGATLFLLFIIDLPCCTFDSVLQSFADDTRLWKHIQKYEDCLALQADLNRIVKYFQHNQLNLNVKKSKFISYHRGKLKYDLDYTIKNEPIERVKVINDLGIILDEKMNFKSHIAFITAKAKSRFGWIKHFGREFEDPWTIKKLFFTFVLPIVEYGSQIWGPYTGETTARIESIQKQFLLFALRKMKWSNGFKLPSYENRLLELQMITLAERRKIAQILMVHNVLLGHTSSKYIMNEIHIITPHLHTRRKNYLDKKNFLKLPIRHRDYAIFEPVNNMLTLYNSFFYKYVPIKPPLDLDKTNENYNNFTVSVCDTYLIDYNVSTETVKHRLNEFFKRSRSWKD